MRALIYTRVSEDRAGGRSPAEQEAEARQVCQRENWAVAHVVTDSLGASRHSKGTRAGWKKAKAIVGAGDVDILVTWEASRAQRDLEAYAELRRLCADTGVLWNYSGRTYDLRTKDDRFSTGLDALLAEREADETSDRVRRATRANAAAGRPHGRRLYGYERTYDPTTGRLTGQVPHPSEAPAVRSAYAWFLSGEGLRTIARRLNDAGDTTSTGARWTDSQVRRLLSNPAYAARRVHRGEIIGAADWPPLVDPATFDRAQQLADERRTRNTRYTGKARLLTGVARCGKCGGKMVAIHDHKIRKVYACRDKFEVSRDMLKLDAYVAETLIRHLQEKAADAKVPDGPGDDSRDRAAAERARLDEAVDLYTAGKLTASTLARIEQRVLAELAAIDRAARSRPGPLLDITVPAGVDEGWSWWESLDPSVRREIVAAHVGAVVVLPTGKGRGRGALDTDCVRIEWR